MRSVLVIGLGRFGRHLAAKLYDLDVQVMAVDRLEERVSKVLNYVTVAKIGDGTDEKFLSTLGIPDFDACVVSIGDDFISSLETTSLLKELGARKVISRASSGTQEKFLLRNGADEVVFPEKQLAVWTAIRASSDAISNYIELSEGYAIYEVECPPEWDGKTVLDINIRSRYEINFLGYREESGVMNMNVKADTVLQKGFNLLVLGKDEDIQKCFKI